MTDAISTNGRVTQQQLYTAIGDMRVEMQTSFRDVRSDIKVLDTRLRSVEQTQIREQGHDEAQNEMLEKQEEIKTEQGVSRRWLAGLALATTTSVALSIVSIVFK